MRTTLDNGTLTATIDSKGAELISLRDASGREYMWEGNPDFWGKHSPVLFPIVGTLKDNRFLFDGKEYSLPRHGFARDREFTIEEKTAHRVVFLLESDAASMENYPFPFQFRLVYTLSGSSLGLEYNVRNTGNGTMWFSVGGHPAFALPGDFASYEMVMETPEVLDYYLLENDLLSGATGMVDAGNGTIPLDYALFENDALVFKTTHSKKIRLQTDGRSFLEIDFQDFPHLGIWTKPGAPFICIEPWFGYADTTQVSGKLEEKEGVLSLSAHSAFSASFQIHII